MHKKSFSRTNVLKTRSSVLIERNHNKINAIMTNFEKIMVWTRTKMTRYGLEPPIYLTLLLHSLTKCILAIIYIDPWADKDNTSEAFHRKDGDVFGRVNFLPPGQEPYYNKTKNIYYSRYTFYKNKIYNNVDAKV